MPSLLTCVVGKPLCSRETDDHWKLRDFAASLVGQLVRRSTPTHTCLTTHSHTHAFFTRFSSSLRSLEAKVTNTLVRALLDAKRPAPARYGATIGIAELGAEAVQRLLLEPIGESNMAFLHALVRVKT